MTNKLIQHCSNAAAAIALVAAAAISGQAVAADHAEAPRVTADPPADIADVYLFRSADSSRIFTIMTFGGIAAPNPPLNPTGVGMYDEDVLYVFSIDRNPDVDGDDGIVAEHSIYVRFGRDPNGNVAVKVENLPGTSEPVVGPVETVIQSPEGLRVYAGLRDDPFSFDSIGFGRTLASFTDDPNDNSGEFMFDQTRDTFGFRNLTAIVLEMDTQVATQGSRTIRYWGTTRRIIADD